MTLTSHAFPIFILEPSIINCICKYFQVLVNACLYINQHCFKLPKLNMYECICCLLHIFPTRVFLDTRIGSSPDASSLQIFEVFITHVWPKYQPNPNPLNWSLVMSMIYFVVALCWGWDKRPLHILTKYNSALSVYDDGARPLGATPHIIVYGHGNFGSKIVESQSSSMVTEIFVTTHTKFPCLCVVMHGTCCPSQYYSTPISKEYWS